MLPRSNGAVWMDGEEDEAISWPPRTHDDNGAAAARDDEMNASLTSFKSMLETDYFINNAINTPNPFFHSEFSTLLFNSLDSAFSCSPSQPFQLDPSHQMPAYLLPKSMLPSLFANNFDLSLDQSFFPAPDAASAPILMGFNGFNSQFQSNSEIPAVSRMFPFSDDNSAAAIGAAPNAFNFEGFDASGRLLPNGSKLLRSLEVLPPVGAQPTLFQKRAALRHSSRLHNLGTLSSKSDEGLTNVDDTGEMDMGRKRKRNFDDEMEDLGADISTMNYDSDDPTEEES